MLAGLRRSGKSTLADIVEGEVSDHRHREDCYFRTRTFEVPGGYVENHWMAKEIIMLGHNQACSMALLLDGTTLESLYSAGYARAFSIPTLGVVTKCEGLGGPSARRAPGCCRRRDVARSCAHQPRQVRGLRITGRGSGRRSRSHSDGKRGGRP